MFGNKYEEHAANCVRLAEETKDAMISFAAIKMANAWLDLGEKNSRTDLVHEAPLQPSSGKRFPRRSRHDYRLGMLAYDSVFLRRKGQSK